MLVGLISLWTSFCFYHRRAYWLPGKGPSLAISANKRGFTFNGIGSAGSVSDLSQAKLLPAGLGR